jgi:hypothetical protein
VNGENVSISSRPIIILLAISSNAHVVFRVCLSRNTLYVINVSLVSVLGLTTAKIALKTNELEY